MKKLEKEVWLTPTIKTECNKGGTPEIYESPKILYKDILMLGILCASPVADYGSYINDAEQEEDNIFETSD